MQKMESVNQVQFLADADCVHFALTDLGKA